MSDMPATRISPLLIDARELSRLLSVSPATVHRMHSSGRVPKPIALSAGCIRWHRPTIERWLALCNSEGRLIDRREWQAMDRKNNGEPL